MKNIFTLLFIISSHLVLAQGNATITGVVKDSTSNLPVEFATVALTEPSTGKPIDGTVCDEAGRFTINKVAVGDYEIAITFIGFETKTITVKVEDKKDDINLGTIIISPTQQVLKEVTIEGQKSIIEERVDRTIYNAENDQTARGGDATDVLKRVPMLTVDLDGNVSLRGNQNILVLINNKPSSIMASSVSDALKQIPADQIKSVEVITSPSAKYDAEGSAGIINIITKKNNLEGLTLGIDAGVGLRGSNLGLNGNFRRGKMGFSLGGWGRANYNVTGEFENSQLTKNPESGAEALSIQRAATRSNALFGHYNLGWDYDINKKNLLAASVRFGVRNQNNYQDRLLSQFYSSGNLVNTDLRNAITNDESNSVDVNFNYTHLYEKPQREFSVQALYSRNNRQNDFENQILNETDFSTIGLTKNLNDSYNEEMTLQVDYQSPVSTNQMFEVGGKSILRKAFSDFTLFESNAEGILVPSQRSDLTNNLNYDQNVSAGYLSYTLTTKNAYSFKTGARYEYTTIKAYTQTEDNIEIPSYGVLVPSINASKKLKNGNMLKASYNRRIQRPSIRFLNPNIQRANPLDVTLGNPELDPEFTNNYEVSYSTFIKGTSLNFSVFTRNTNDAIQSVREVIPGFKDPAQPEFNTPDTIRTTFQNIGREDAYGASLFANVNIGKLSLNGGTDVYYAVLDNNNPVAADRFSNEGWVASGRLFGSYNLEKGWGFQFFGFYRGNRIQLQGTQGNFYIYSLSLRKEFNEKRGSIGVGAENFITSPLKIRTELTSPTFEKQSVSTINNISFRINFSYRIGKMSVDAPRRRRSINNDDLKEGGGDNPMGGDVQSPPSSRGFFGGGQRRTSSKSKKATESPKVTSDSVSTTLYPAEGTWNFTIDSPQGGGGTLVITKNDNVYAGTIKTQRMKQEAVLKDITVTGNKVSFTYTINMQGNAIEVTVDTSITGDNMQGEMNIGEARSFNISGKRSQ